MKNLFSKSIETDFQKIISNLAILQKNMVYVTYRCDSILKILKDNQTDKSLQKQVDEYFDGSDNGNSPDHSDAEPD